MTSEDFRIEKDIRKAQALPGKVFDDPRFFEEVRERIFARSWQLVGSDEKLKASEAIFPTMLLPVFLDEPLLLTRDSKGVFHCLSNVCTHRGAILCEKECVQTSLRCPYHGRRFGLDGSFLSMPEFEGVEGFPSEKDNLHRVPLGRWKKFLFASLDPVFPLEEMIQPMEDRVGFLPMEKAVFDPTRSRDYEVQANWALYCDNFLEGFHIPFVHPSLSEVLDYSKYSTELFPYATLQVGIADTKEDVFDLPRSSPDFGRRVAGYYFWLFPNTMFNFYPWGISINVVKPVAPDKSVVSFSTHVWDASKLERGAGAGLHQVELEDERVVQSVQRGVRSRFYRPARYSPTQEKGVHHFHRLLIQFLLLK